MRVIPRTIMTTTSYLLDNLEHEFGAGGYINQIYYYNRRKLKRSLVYLLRSVRKAGKILGSES